MTTEGHEFYTRGPWMSLQMGSINVPTYYLIISLTTCLCILWLYRRSGSQGFSIDQGLNMGLLLLIFGFLGARLTHILYEAPQYYWQNPTEVFSIFSGGFVFYGGAIAGYTAAFIYLKLKKLPLWPWHDLFAPIAALGYALGRLACFFNGCCFGKVCPWPWALPLEQVDLHSGLATHILRHPTALYASIWEGLLLVLLLFIEKKKTFSGQVFLIWLMGHSLGRLFMEAFRADDRGAFIFGWLSISSLISLVLFAAGVTLYIRKQPRLSLGQ